MVHSSVQVVLQVWSAVEQERVRLRVNHNVIQGLNLVRDLVAESIVDRRIDNVPATTRQWVDNALCFRFVLELIVHGRVSIAVRIRFLVRFCQGRIDFVNGVRRAVNARVHTHAEEVLMDRGRDLRCDGVPYLVSVSPGPVTFVDKMPVKRTSY